MRELAANFELREPTFEANGYFKATFYRPGKPEEKVRVGGIDQRVGLVGRLVEKRHGKAASKDDVGLVERLVDGLAENQRRVLVLILENSTISKAEMSKNLKISTTAIDKNIAALKKKGLLRRVGPDKGGYWEIVG